MSDTKMNPKQLDIAHIFFLELLRDYKNNLGAPLAVRQMNNRASMFAQNLPRQDFSSWKNFVEALKKGETVFSLWESSLDCHEMIVATADCPFATAIRSYIEIMGGMPNEYSEITDEFNRASSLNQKNKYGQGSACSPFCAIHQPLRTTTGSKIFIEGQPLKVVALGSRLDKEHMLAYEYLAEEKIIPEKVKKILENNICCFLLKMQSGQAADKKV